MRLLDRYLLRELLLPLAYCLGGFLVCIIIFDVFDMLDEFQRNHLNARDLLDYYGYRIPQLMVTSYVMPMSLLLGLLYALTNHSRHHELTAMRAAGLSLMRISMPYFAVGIVFSGLTFLLNETVVPDAADNAERVLARHAVNKPKAGIERLYKKNVLFLNPHDNRIWQIGVYNLQTRQMANVLVESRLPNGAHVEVYAERGWWTNRHWAFSNVQQFQYAREGEMPIKTIIAETNLPRIIETPRLIASEIKISSIETLRSLRRAQLSTGSILDYLRLHPKLDETKHDYLMTLLHSRLATPWTCFVVVLIAIPFASLPGRRNVFVGVASSIFICVVFFIVKDLTLALGSAGHVPAWVAAWVPNTMFAVAGLVMLWKVR